MGISMSDTVLMLDQALLKALSLTMEDMAFEQVDKITDDERIKDFERISPDGEENLLDETDHNGDNSNEQAKFWAVLKLKAPLTGDIVIEVKRNYAAAVCDALYGMGLKEPHDEMIGDTMAELLNTISGCFMKELIPPEQKYELGFPVTGKGIFESQDDPAMVSYYDISGNVLKVTLVGTDFNKSRLDRNDIQEGE